jgi:hypothetical protein
VCGIQLGTRDFWGWTWALDALELRVILVRGEPEAWVFEGQSRAWSVDASLIP